MDKEQWYLIEAGSLPSGLTPPAIEGHPLVVLGF